MFLLFCSSFLFGQSISIIDCQTGNPIEGVLIQSSSQIFGVTSTDGRLSLKHLQPADTVIIKHTAYHLCKKPAAELTEAAVICLDQKVFNTDSVVISAEKNYESTGFVQSVTLHPVDKAKYEEIGAVLRAKTDLYIKEYGGYAALKTISARGLGSENTLVLFNNARINDLATGSFDFSQLSTFSVKKIRYSKSGDDDNPYSMGGGVLEISSIPESSERSLLASFRVSSDNLKAVSSQYSDSCGSVYYSAGFERAYSPNNYPYRFEGKELERQNAFFSKTRLELNGSYRTSSTLFTFHNNYQSFHNGIPGAVVSNNHNSLTATSSNKSNLHIVNLYQTLSESVTGIGTIFYQNQTLQIHDPAGIVVYKGGRKETEMYNAGVSLKGVFSKEHFTWGIGYDVHRGSVDNLAVIIAGNNSYNSIAKTANRLYTFGAITIPFENKIVSRAIVKVSGGNEWESERTQGIAHRVSTMFKSGIVLRSTLLDGLLVKVNFGNEFRNPTFYERYYANLYGNYAVKPEHFIRYEAGVEYNNDDILPINFAVNYFSIDGNNRIVWTPTRYNLQTPKNILKTKSTGVEISGTIGFIDTVLVLSGAYNYNSVKNMTLISSNDLSYGKQLIYTPLHRSRIECTWNAGVMRVICGAVYIDKSYYASDNSPYSKLPAYAIIDASLSLQILKNHLLSISVQNLNNQSYFIIESYPMPLRTYQIHYSMEIK